MYLCLICGLKIVLVSIPLKNVTDLPVRHVSDCVKRFISMLHWALRCQLIAFCHFLQRFYHLITKAQLHKTIWRQGHCCSSQTNTLGNRLTAQSRRYFVVQSRTHLSAGCTTHLGPPCSASNLRFKCFSSVIRFSTNTCRSAVPVEPAMHRILQ